MTVTLSFYGAAGTVTGSRYLLDVDGDQSLIDCGLFQGHKELRELNWREPPFPPSRIERVLLTHAHIDHCGALPRLAKQGFSGPVLCSRATKRLARLLLLDSAKLHEEDARYANRKSFSKHKPALPLYDEQDAKRALKQFRAVERGEWVQVDRRLRVRWHPAGHILGSATLELRVPRPGSRGEEATIVFSGDVGRYAMPLHVDPEPMPPCDVLICESTYGDRVHDHDLPVDQQLEDAIGPILADGGTVLIPAFAVGRSQQLILMLRELMDAGRLPETPIHLDSPMAVDATRIYSDFLDEHHLDAELLEGGRSSLFPDTVTLHRSTAQSKQLNELSGPRIILSASGMLTGGRVLHHLARLVTDRRNLIVLAGFQAAGTRGRKLLEGQPTIRVHGADLPVRARCVALHGLSAHADRDELLRWVGECGVAPRQVFLTHGEPEAAEAFALTLRRRLGWSVSVPKLDDRVELDRWLE